MRRHSPLYLFVFVNFNISFYFAIHSLIDCLHSSLLLDKNTYSTYLIFYYHVYLFTFIRRSQPSR